MMRQALDCPSRILEDTVAKDIAAYVLSQLNHHDEAEVLMPENLAVEVRDILNKKSGYEATTKVNAGYFYDNGTLKTIESTVYLIAKRVPVQKD